MALAIRHRKIVEPHEDVTMAPLASWKGEPGVILTTADSLDSIVGHLNQLSVIAIEFPQFTDGRGYSMARLLRERFGFEGEIRAVGDVLRDNLFYLSRCGFDGFVLSDRSTLEQALESLSDFSEGYQASVERPEPLFRRRAA
jgi:uncharacterized protein (DUF934 family)